MLAAWVSSQIIVNGIVQGVVYGLLAMTLVLVYRTSKVINFAVGNIGIIGSAVLLMLDVTYGIPFWFALIVALVAGTLYAVVIELSIIRRLFSAPRVIVLVATIGVSQLSQAIILGFPDIGDPRANYPSPITADWNIGSARLKGAQLLILIVGPLAALALTWFLTSTLLGRSVRAASSNPDLARLSGVNPKFVSTAVWAISGFVATVSMILLGGLDGSVGSIAAVGPVSLLRALTAAIIARFVSFRVALLAGLVIGVVEQLLRFNFLDKTGLTDVALLLVVLLAVGLQRRDRAVGDAVFSFVPRTLAMPERLRSIWWIRHLDRVGMLAMLLVAALAPIIITQPSRQLLYSTIAALAICALSLTLLTGWAGQLSLGQMAFAGIGALSAAAFTRGLEIDWMIGDRQIVYLQFEPLPFVLSIFLAGFVTAALAGIVGLGALRVRGLLLAASTFALSIATGSYLYRTKILGAGESASVDFRRGDLFGIDLNNQRNYYYLVLATLVVVAALLGRLRRSGIGRVTIAVRDNEVTAAAYTVGPTAAKLRTFALSGAIAGIGGGFLAGATQELSFVNERFLVTGSLTLVAMVVIGGLGSIAGAVVGAFWVVGLPALAPGNDIIPLLTSSLGLLILLLYFPGGLVEVAHRGRSALYRYLENRLPPIEKSTTASTPAVRSRRPMGVESGMVPLQASGICVNFGGVRANDEITLTVGPGEIVGLIGTNGAGKTTLMNAIGGYLPASGRVELFGQDLSALSPAERARRGLGRTFQSASLFPELTVRETVEVALEGRGRTGLIATALFWPRASARARAQRQDAAELIDFLGLGRYGDRPISELSTGTRRIVELAGLLALDAKVLCLDEPTAGIAQREAEAMGPLLVQIRRELGAAMLIIEHDMPLIMGMSDRVYCLEFGRVIAQGLPNEVRNDPKVIASYLGTDERTIQRSGAFDHVES